MAMIAMRSKILKDKFVEKLKDRTDKNQKVVIDFEQQVHFQAFKKIIDFCYLGDPSVINTITDSSEMIELIKLANLFGLN